MKIAAVTFLAMLVSACASAPPAKENAQGTLETVESFCKMTYTEFEEQRQCVTRLTELSSEVYKASREIELSEDGAQAQNPPQSADVAERVDSASE